MASSRLTRALDTMDRATYHDSAMQQAIHGVCKPHLDKAMQCMKAKEDDRICNGYAVHLEICVDTSIVAWNVARQK